MYDMRRVIVLDHEDEFKHEISPSEVDALDVVEEMNGVHTLTISTTKVRLSIGDRVLSPRTDATAYSRLYNEWVVYGMRSTHDRSGSVRVEYTCIWFAQYDGTCTYVDTSVGVIPFQESQLKPALTWFANTIDDDYWQAGGHVLTNDNPSWDILQVPSRRAAASFYHMDGWECIKRFLERWGGELDCYTSVSFPVTQRSMRRILTIPDRLGSSTPVARFDYGWDVENIERTVHDGVWACCIVPLGKSTQTASGGYTRRPTIESVNSGDPRLWNIEVAQYVVRNKYPPEELSPSGHFYFYPTAIVKNDVYEDPADLKAWAEEHLEELTMPKVTYKVNAIELGAMGYSNSKVRLGDTVMVVDNELVEDGLRIEVRVRRIEYSLLNDTLPTTLTLGNENPSITNALQATDNEVSVIREQMDLQQTT